MNRDAIRAQTVLIIRRPYINEYLVGKQISSGRLVWSTSKYDAWRTRDKNKAWKVARKTGGEPVLFNPIAGRTKAL